MTARRAFEAAARHPSFKAAADELSLTPSAISHEVRLREDILGCTLFRHRPPPLALTEAGVALFPVIRDGLDAFAAAAVQVRDSVDPQKAAGDNDKRLRRALGCRACRCGAKPIPRLRSR